MQTVEVSDPFLQEFTGKKHAYHGRCRFYRMHRLSQIKDLHIACVPLYRGAVRFTPIATGPIQTDLKQVDARSTIPPWRERIRLLALH
jgi:hypothetical protein